VSDRSIARAFRPAIATPLLEQVALEVLRLAMQPAPRAAIHENVVVPTPSSRITGSAWRTAIRNVGVHSASASARTSTKPCSVIDQLGAIPARAPIVAPKPQPQMLACPRAGGATTSFGPGVSAEAADDSEGASPCPVSARARMKAIAGPTSLHDVPCTSRA